ncbi:MAG: hypothetical protein ACMUHU_02580 [Thermoplasmatota archaeon]
MSLFGKKKEIRFETILIDRERDVFRQLESRGWTLCTDPFQFDVQKSHEKLRKDALKMARELHAELLVEVWDPIYQHMHWKGLKYSAWRRATREEMMERQKKKTGRPDYSDSMGSMEEIARKLEQKKLRVDTEELHQYDSVLTTDPTQMEGEVYGNAEEDMGMVTEHFETFSSQNPYDHQGRSASDLEKRSLLDSEAASQGPMFDGGMTLETGAPDSSDPTKEIDPLALMMDAAPGQETQQSPAPQPQPQPQSQPQPQPQPPSQSLPQAPPVHQLPPPQQQPEPQAGSPPPQQPPQSMPRLPSPPPGSQQPTQPQPAQKPQGRSAEDEEDRGQ